MTKDSNSLLRVKFATAAGLVTGVIKGNKEASKKLAPFDMVMTAGDIGSDTYMKNKSEFDREAIAKNIDAVSNSPLKPAEKIKEFQKISLDAANEFEYLAKITVKKVIKEANKVKAKYILGFSAIGLALDVAVNSVVNKILNHN